MERVVSIASPAKVNLHLDVLQKRSDGYHELVSIFQMVDFGDELSIRSLKERNACIIEGDFDFDPSRNTIWKAVRLFRDVTGIDQGVCVSVRKAIPCGSGTGGGSSNAASALRALDALFDTRLGAERFAEIGAEIGSDVPFFCVSPAAFVTGRGEILQPIAGVRTLFGVLLYPDISVATSLAYGWLDEACAAGEEPDAGSRPGASELIRMYEEADPRSWTFFNSFFPVVARRYPVLAGIRNELYGLGAVYANMSGSGSAVFGFFPSQEGAQAAAEKISGSFSKIEVVKLLDRLPDAVLQ